MYPTNKSLMSNYSMAYLLVVLKLGSLSHALKLRIIFISHFVTYGFDIWNSVIEE